MNKVFPLCILLLSGVVSQMAAQTYTATFAFGSIQSDNCSPITAWNGVSNAYPNDMGSVCFNLYPNPYSGLEAPSQLGFPNNGFLANETPFTWGPIVWTSGNGSHSGDTFTETGTALYGDCGVTVNVNVAFETKIVRSCYRGVCRNTVYNILTGGTGSASF